MDSYCARVAPGERRRRDKAIAKGRKIALKLGFREVPDRPGHWKHPDLGEGSHNQFALTLEHCPVDSIGEALGCIYEQAYKTGRAVAQLKAREAFGL